MTDQAPQSERSLHEGTALYYVFVQSKKGGRHTHVGDVWAPDSDLALLFAKEHYARREPCVSIWVVPHDRVVASPPEWEEWFQMDQQKRYRLPNEYPADKYIPRSSAQFIQEAYGKPSDGSDGADNG